MGLLVAFGDDANFVLTVGGFHPRFSPPPLPFPVPRRIAIDILNSPTAKLRVEGYFAVTTNTAQFGAPPRLSSASTLNVEGISPSTRCSSSRPSISSSNLGRRSR